MGKNYFFDLNLDDISAEVVVVDIDGCLVPDGGIELSRQVADFLLKLGADREVFLLSNKKNHERNLSLAQVAGVNYLETDLRKPDPRLKSLLSAMVSDFDQKTKIVIGDKYLTDGLFAKVIGAEFIKVKRLVGGGALKSARAAELADDLVYAFSRYVKLLRPAQWLKNLLILAPLVFAHELANQEKLSQAVLGVVIFSMLASAVYIFNDWWDAASDRLHPKKKKRPLASGSVPVFGAALLGGLLTGGVIFLTQNFFPATAWLLTSYVVLNLFYSAYFKKVVVLDVVTVAVFYLIRIIYGGLLVGVAVSDWLVLCTIFLAVFIIIGKRFGESRRVERRAVLDQYPPELLSGLLLVSSALTILSYSIYTISASDSSLMVYSNLPVLFGVFRFIYLVYRGRDTESPELMVFTDPGIFLSVLTWLALVGLAVYY